LIDTSQKENLVTFEAMIASDHIGQHFLVSVTDMWRRVCVIDRRRHEKFLWHWLRDIAGARRDTQPATVAAWLHVISAEGAVISWLALGSAQGVHVVPEAQALKARFISSFVLSLPY
jgi:hypothetical protein